MVQTRIENGTLGKNNNRTRGDVNGLFYESKSEMRFIERFHEKYDLKNANPLEGDGFVYKPDFWSEKLQSYIEIKSTWSFDVLMGKRNYNSEENKKSKQLSRIKELRTKHMILIIVESKKDFYCIDPMNIEDFNNLRLESQTLLP
jgi:hypothetical protein